MRRARQAGRRRAPTLRPLDHMVRDREANARWLCQFAGRTRIRLCGAGLVIHQAHTIPEPDQAFTYYGCRFEILRKSRNKITALRLKPVGPIGAKPGRRSPTHGCSEEGGVSCAPVDRCQLGAGGHLVSRLWRRGAGGCFAVPHPAAGHDRRGHEQVRPEVSMPGSSSRPATTAHRRAIYQLLMARGLRDFGDGFVAVLLPAYLTALEHIPERVEPIRDACRHGW